MSNKGRGLGLGPFFHFRISTSFSLYSSLDFKFGSTGLVGKRQQLRIIQNLKYENNNKAELIIIWSPEAL